MPYLSDMFHEQNRSGPTPSGQAAHGGNGAAAGGTGTFDAASIARRLATRILGQPAAVEAVRRALVVAQAGVHDRARPLANLLLVGPTGVGKTELVRRLAGELRSGPDDLCRVDMSQLAQEHYAASFSGAPPGYAGSKEGYSVFDRAVVEGTPYTPGIVLFDEVEKAHPTVLRALLGVLDRGTLRLAGGEQTLSFRNAFVFMTSNLGSRAIARRRRLPWRRDERIIERAVRSFFDPEFLNRVDEVVRFAEIGPHTATRITALEIDDVLARLRRRGLDATVEPDAEDRVVTALRREGFDPVHGARSLRRTVRRRVLVPAAEELITARAAGSTEPKVRIGVENGQIVVRAVPPE